MDAAFAVGKHIVARRRSDSWPIPDPVVSAISGLGFAVRPGALTLTILGLNGSYGEITETVTMDGTTNVTTSNTYIMIYRMYVATAGSTGTNEGAITATAQTDGTVTARIEALEGQTTMAIYQVPASKTAYLYHDYASMNGSVATATSADIRLMVKSFGGAWQAKHILGLASTGTSLMHYDNTFPLVITEKSLIKLDCLPSQNNVDVTGGFDLVLIDN